MLGQTFSDSRSKVWIYSTFALTFGAATLLVSAGQSAWAQCTTAIANGSDRTIESGGATRPIKFALEIDPVPTDACNLVRAQPLNVAQPSLPPPPPSPPAPVVLAPPPPPPAAPSPIVLAPLPAPPPPPAPVVLAPPPAPIPSAGVVVPSYGPVTYPMPQQMVQTAVPYPNYPVASGQVVHVIHHHSTLPMVGVNFVDMRRPYYGAPGRTVAIPQHGMRNPYVPPYSVARRGRW